MTRKLFFAGLALVVCVGIMVAFHSEKAGSAPEAGARGPNERFYTVQEKLDPGGSFYLYADLKDGLRNFMNELQPIVTDPQMPPEVSKGYMIANTVLDRLGLYGLYDLGISVMPDGALQRGKIFISSPGGRQKGLMSLLGGEPHPFAALDHAPADTLLLATVDFDANAAWSLVRQIAQDIKGIEGLAQLDQAVSGLNEKCGLNLPALIPTLAGEFTIIGAQDAAGTATLPLGPAPVSIKSPRLAVMIRVKDDSFYQALKSLLTRQSQPGAAGAGQSGPSEVIEGKLRKIAVPLPPNPFWPLSPVIATDGSYVYIATHDDYLKAVSAPQAAGAGLRAAEEFKQLSAGLPSEGNGLCFAGSRLIKTVQEVMQTAIQNIPKSPAGRAFQKKMLEKIQASKVGGISMRINGPDGILVVSRSDVAALQYVPALMAAPVAIMAAIAVPNFLEAQGRSKVSRARADMRSMATAIESYYIDTNAYPAWSNDPGRNAFGELAKTDPSLASEPTFMMKKSISDPLMTLTTPVMYITSYMSDPFAQAKGATFSYWATKNGWILWSPGPDGKYSLSLENIAKAYDPAAHVPSPDLIGMTYDPTNGTISMGDIWRIKQ